MAQAAAEQLCLPEIRWIVSGRAVHKAAIASATDRLAMTRLALSDLGDSRMVVDDREVLAGQMGQETPSYRTVQSFQLEFPSRPLIWILGEDQLLSFTQWQQWRWLLGQLTIAVCQRPEPVQGDSQAGELLMQAGAKIRKVKFPADQVSSTEIRSRVAQGLPIALAVSPSVARYIQSNQVYFSSQPT